MGRVYLARDKELDRAVAVKTLREAEWDPEVRANFLERFRNEARAAARLHHPSVVGVYDVGDDPEVGPYLVFEYVPGATLKSILRSQGKLSPNDVVRFADQIAAALDAAHELGIIHRDIKPDNLLVTEDGRVKLTDFGVARLPDAQLTRDGQFLGTPCYAAPETLTRSEYSRSSDLFSFGAVLYEVVTGVRAFPGDDAVAVAHSVIHDTPRKPSEVPGRGEIVEGLDELLMRCLSKEPETRPRSASEIARAIRAVYVATGETISAGSEQAATIAASPKSKAKSSRVLYGAGLFGALAAGIAAVIYFHEVPPIFGDENAAPVDAAAIALVDAATQANQASALDAGAMQDAALDARGPSIDAQITADTGSALAPDTGPPSQNLSAFEREEAAKDQLDRARALLESGDLAGARAALEEAKILDPSNPDIGRLAAEIR